MEGWKNFIVKIQLEVMSFILGSENGMTLAGQICHTLLID